jgi:hypothetical protein
VPRSTRQPSDLGASGAPLPRYATIGPGGEFGGVGIGSPGTPGTLGGGMGFSTGPPGAWSGAGSGGDTSGGVTGGNGMRILLAIHPKRVALPWDAAPLRVGRDRAAAAISLAVPYNRGVCIFARVQPNYRRPTRLSETGMSSGTPARDFLLPRLTALIDEAVAHGFARQVAVAVLIDLITAPDFDTGDPDPEAASDPQPDYERSPDDPPMIDGVVIGGSRQIGAQDEADFVRPLRWDR